MKNIYKFLQKNHHSSGIEGNPTVFYRLIRGSTAQTNKYDTFYLQQRQDNGFTWADIKVNHPLDYETNKEYNLTIRVEVSLVKIYNDYTNFHQLSPAFSNFRSCFSEIRIHF